MSKPCIVAQVIHAALLGAMMMGAPDRLLAQPPSIRVGEVVPRDVREIYDRGLQFLANAQNEGGDWKGGGEQGPGVTGMALMVFLASGEDPNFGLYSNHVRRALRHIITQQNTNTGICGSSMYHHGFATLALAEAYGAVDDRNLWADAGSKGRSIGESLEFSVRAAITSQKKNPLSAWRYSPDAHDADTSVSGMRWYWSVFQLAARNAGIEVPDEAIDKAISFYTTMTDTSGQVAYAGGIGNGGESLARTSIATLVYSIARRKDLPQFKAALEHLTQRLGNPCQWLSGITPTTIRPRPFFRATWRPGRNGTDYWCGRIKTKQQSDGSIPSQFGVTIGTSLSLLALAVNYRFLPIYER